MRRVFVLGLLAAAAHAQACILDIPDSPPDQPVVPEACEVGVLLPCYDGPEGTRDVAPCRAGVAECLGDGALGSCEQQVLPVLEACASEEPLDDDCNGAVNEHCALWAATFGGYGDQGFESLAVAQFGELFVEGQNNGAIDFGGDELETEQFRPGQIVARLGPDGQTHRWSKMFDARATVLNGASAWHSEIGFFVAGAFSDWLRYDTVTYLSDYGLPHSIYVALLDANDGSIVEVAPFGDGDLEDEERVQTAHALAPTEDGVMLGGAASGGIDFGAAGSFVAVGGSDAVIARLGADLVPMWALLVGDVGDDRVESIAVDPAGSIYVAGTFGSTFDLAGSCQVLTSAGAGGAFLAKLDPTDGACVWARAFAADGGAQIFSLRWSQELYVGVTFVGNTSVDEGSPITGVAGEDALLAVVDPDSGAVVRHRVFAAAENQRLWDIAVGPEGLVAVVGSTGSAIDFGGGPLPVQPIRGADDAFVVVLDENLDHVFSRHFAADGDDDAIGVGFDEDGGLIVAGEFTGDIDFGTGRILSNDVDAFVMRLGL
jgi:hypothetical protein